MNNFNILTLILCLGIVMISSAQNSAGKSDDAARIAIKAFVPDDLGDLTPKAKNALKSRLERIVTKNGIGGSSYENRFVLTAKVVEFGKDFVPGTPPIYNYELEITLLIGDAIEGTLFSSHVIDVKGAGNTEERAYLAALKRIRDKNPEYQSFIDESKTKIIEYYNSQCDFILKEADMLVSQNEFQAAIATLTSIPEICKDCFDKAMDEVGSIYQKQIDRQCKLDMIEAKNVWNASQDGDGANSAAYYLGNIDPNSSCYNEAQTFSNTIAKRIKELDQREWDFEMKQQQDNVDVRKAEIESARAIGVAYGENQPKSVVYNYRSWWY